MRTEPTFVSVKQVLAIHERMVREFGGDPGLRDRGLLESAVGMPRATFGGEYVHEDLAAMAAAYLFHICRNHAFVDGNKRTAMAAAEVFFDLNDFALSASDEDMEHPTRGVATGEASKAQVAGFFRNAMPR